MENNKHLQVYAYRTMVKYPDRIKVLYECPCFSTGKKFRHHFDYSRPLDVYLLCGGCHETIHADVSGWPLVTKTRIKSPGPSRTKGTGSNFSKLVEQLVGLTGSKVKAARALSVCDRTVDRWLKLKNPVVSSDSYLMRRI